MDLSQFNSSMYGLETNNQEEANFFLNHLQPHHTVLEWGSGVSTKTIASKVKKVHSIEHNREWFDIVNKQLPENAVLHLATPNELESPGQDGDYTQYHDYIEKALECSFTENKLFDIIFIDGRARVQCSKICKHVAHKDTLIFIHDYNHPDPKYTRTEYYEAEKYLTRIDGVFTMWKFKLK